MELMVISSPHSLHQEASWINRLFEAGMKRFHLREPDTSLRDIRVLLDQLNPAYLKHVVPHQHHGLSLEYGFKRLHFPGLLRKQTDPLKIDSYNKSGITLSSSIHRLDELDGLLNFHYVFFSPVFNSISKQGYLSTISPDFQLTRNPAGPDIIALGGIDHHNIQKLSAMNFDGAAMLGAIWNGPADPLTNFQHIFQALKQAND